MNYSTAAATRVGDHQTPMPQNLFDVSNKKIRVLSRFDVSDSVEGLSISATDGVDVIILAWDYVAFMSPSGQALIRELASAFPDATFAALHPGVHFAFHGDGCLLTFHFSEIVGVNVMEKYHLLGCQKVVCGNFVFLSYPVGALGGNDLTEEVNSFCPCRPRDLFFWRNDNLF
jgi:hypothetical protein